MSEEETKGMPQGRSFEERVFARFDAIDLRLDGTDARLLALENQAERRALETKAIWEFAPPTTSLQALLFLSASPASHTARKIISYLSARV